MIDPRAPSSAWDEFGFEFPFAAPDMASPRGIAIAQAESPFNETPAGESLAWLDYEGESPAAAKRGCSCGGTRAEGELDDDSAAEWGESDAGADEWTNPEAYLGEQEDFPGFARETPVPDGDLWSFFSAAANIRVALFVPASARKRGQVDALLYIHGLLFGVCRAPGLLPEGLASSSQFKLADSIAAAPRPTVLIVPLLQRAECERWSSHGINRAAVCNALIAEALVEIGKRAGGAVPRLDKLAIAGHSKAYEILNPLAGQANDPEMAQGALASLAQFWALDSTYAFSPTAYRALRDSKPSLGVNIVYLKGGKTDKFASRKSEGRLHLWPVVSTRSMRHCDVPGKYIPLLLQEMATPSGAVHESEADFAFDAPAFEGETPDHRFSDCPPGSKALLAGAAARALRAVNYAAAVVGSAYGRPDRMSPATRALLERNFHTAKHDALRTILANLMGIGTTLKKGVRFECETACEAEAGGMVCGYANASQWFGGSGAVHVCFDPRPGHCRFDTQPPRMQAKIVIHEVAHRYRGIDDHAYGHQAAYATLSPGKALDNADSYACFAVDLLAAAPPPSAREADDEAWLPGESEDPELEGFDDFDEWGETGDFEDEKAKRKPKHMGPTARELFQRRCFPEEAAHEAAADEEENESGRFDAFDDVRDTEWESDEDEGEEHYAGAAFDEDGWAGEARWADEAPSPLDTSGLTEAERKAVEITSTLETGKPGGFYGLSGNFDGQGLSFGLVNWTIGTGSLQPLLIDFAREQPDRWARIFGGDAASFLATIRGPTKAAHAFAVERMNSRTTVQAKKSKRTKTVWAIKEPWLSCFKALAEDDAFRRIQIRYVRVLLKKADEYCRRFKLKSEMAFAFMFDAVSSHGPWWLVKKFGPRGARTERRRVLIEQRLAMLNAMAAWRPVGEKDVLDAIAEVLAATSAARWADNVRIRKHWFTGGPAPRSAKELAARVPRADIPYTVSSDTPTSADESVWFEDEAKQRRRPAFATALEQATSAGSQADRGALAATLRANGTTVADWFADIVTEASFLGVPIGAGGGDVAGAHREFVAVLRRAETALLASHSGKTAAQLGRDFGIARIGGLRAPKKATGGGAISMHCFGMAIDVNHDTNPFVGFHKHNWSPCIIGRAMQLVHGESFDVTHLGFGGSDAAAAGRAWDVHDRASRALARYLSLAAPFDENVVAALVRDHGLGRSMEFWRRWIVTDRETINVRDSDFASHRDPWVKGYMDLPRELVVALAEAGLYWGGLYAGAKDIMHFDYRTGTIRARH